MNLSKNAAFGRRRRNPDRDRLGLHRGYDERVRGKRVLVVDDVVNTGLSVRQTVDAVRADGGNVVGVACLVHRGNVDAAGIGVPEYVYLLEYDIPNWPAAKCPLCKQGVPINVEYAHGWDFLDAQNKSARFQRRSALRLLRELRCSGSTARS